MTAAPHAASHLSDDALPDALRAALDDSDDTRAHRAFAWMSVLGVASPDAVASALSGMSARLFDPALSVARRSALASAIAGMPSAATADLVAHLRDHSDDNRAVAAHALSAPRHLEAVPALVRLADDDGAAPHARVAAIDALAAIGDASVSSRLVDLFDDADADVRRAAVVALAGLDCRRGTQAFLRAAQDDDMEVRCGALTALLVAGGAPACTAARRALADGAPAVRALAVVMLARHGGPRDGARVAALADDADARVRRAVREARASSAV